MLVCLKLEQDVNDHRYLCKPVHGLNESRWCTLNLCELDYDIHTHAIHQTALSGLSGFAISSYS